MALVIVAAARSFAFSQSNNAPQTAAPSQQTAAAQSAKLAEAVALSATVVKLHREGKFDEALPLAEQALKLREEAVGGEHRTVADALKNLGALYLAKGKADKGRQHYTRALSIYEKEPATNTVNIYKLLDAIGTLERFAFNNFSAAVERYEQSLTFKESSLGAEHEDVIKTLYELAELYELLGHNDKALAVHRRVVAVREKREATEPYGLVRALNRFSCLTNRLKMKTETDEANRRVEEIRKREDEKLEREEAARPKGEIAGGVLLQSGGKTIQGGVINGKAIVKPQPVYPAEAKQRRISGVVVIHVLVDEKGHVVEAFPCGHPFLAEAALRAAYGARFSPTLLSGMPVKVNGVITYNFILN
ncbi:MAG TPA: TonB family protein [Pyrinomonadaceae bacterium]|nr:TonB family protein [Pyrinomonadaceae bacterium]